jgi:L-ascorbate metabolism protein UlaG (beta-lactamase superfamily)
MSRCGVKSVDATFVNHAHTDHVIDAPMVVNNYGGKLYGSSSVVNVGLGQGLTSTQVKIIQNKDQIKIGSFTIEPFNTPHAPHLFEILLMDGDITIPLKTPTSAWNYRVGKTYSFLIKHPKGTILFQTIGRVYDPDPLKDIKADVLLLTIANRNSSEELIQKRIIPSETKRVIPLHYENFFLKMRRDKVIDEFWGVKVDDFKEKMKLLSNKTLVDWPLYCEGVALF